MVIEQGKFRKALSYFASGVTVITTQHVGQYHGTTVNSFCSLSLDPPLVLVCLDLKSTSHNLISESGVFGVNILAEQDQWLIPSLCSTNSRQILTLPRFWRVGEEKSGTLYEGESPSKTATKFSQGIVGFVLTTYQPCKRTNNFSRSVDYHGYPLITARNASKNRRRAS